MTALPTLPTLVPTLVPTLETRLSHCFYGCPRLPTLQTPARIREKTFPAPHMHVFLRARSSVGSVGSVGTLDIYRFFGVLKRGQKRGQ